LKPQRPSQALGITADIRDKLLAVCGEDLVGLRDQVLVAVGFDTLCRRGELVALAAEDLQPNHHGTLSILVRRAKNDPYGTGRIAHLAVPTVSIVERWLDAAEIAKGPLLRPVYCGHPIPRLMEPYSVGRVLKKLALLAGLDDQQVRQISGHSLRIGAA
jgi:integrase